MLQNDLLIKACRKEKMERTPIWIMRQAGRYLPEYRAIREKVSFLELCKTPELAAQVTIQPVDIIGVDAAIIFSDILVIPEAMGMRLSIEEGTGPIFEEPIRNLNSAKKLTRFDPIDKLKFVLDAISITKRELNGRVPIIGFSGSPFTLLSYMVEGETTKSFSRIKSFIFQERDLAHHVLNLLAENIIDYLIANVKAGADVLQLFDTWGGILAPHHFDEFSLYYLTKIVEGIKSKADVPIILFSKGSNSSLEKIAMTGCDVVGIDWTVDIGLVRKLIGNFSAVQGNLDPTILYASEEKIKEEANRILKSFGNGTGHIFNLGHGIYPDTEPSKLKCLVDYVKSESKKFHQ